MNVDDTRYRWVDGINCTDAEWQQIDAMLLARGWMSLNRATSRILLAETPNGHLLGFNVVQMMPYIGPLFVIPSARGTGIAQELATKLFEFLATVEVRGFIAMAQSKHAEKICVDIGMQLVESPVYILGGRA